MIKPVFTFLLFMKIPVFRDTLKTLQLIKMRTPDRVPSNFRSNFNLYSTYSDIKPASLTSFCPSSLTT